jgi:SAM-dependent methyltransferase
MFPFLLSTRGNHDQFGARATCSQLPTGFILDVSGVLGAPIPGRGYIGRRQLWRIGPIQGRSDQCLGARAGVQRVVDFGCGDGNQLSLAEYPSYVGLDVSGRVIEKTSARFADDESKSFIWYDPTRSVNRGAITGDLVLSLDVILHLVEDATLDAYLLNLDRAGSRYAVVYRGRTNQPG